MKKSSIAIACAGVLSLGGGSAHALDLTPTLGNGSTMSVSAPGIALNGIRGGLFNVTPSGSGWPSYVNGSFLSFCVDLVDTFNPGQPLSGYSIKDYTVVGDYLEGSPPNMPVSVAQLGRIGKLITYASDGSRFGPMSGMTADEASAIQAGIWEIIYEPSMNPGSFSLGAGNFKVTSLLTAKMTQLEGWVTGGSVDQVAVYQQYKILFSEQSKGMYQDFLVPVPEPEAYGLALAGLGVVGFAMRRRRRA